MKLIVGLGNPGEQYESTRHNIGFWLVDRLKREITDPNIVFFKNPNFINEAGKEVRKTIRHFKIPLEDVLVIHDDFDLELGQFKLQFGRSSAGHKGVQSVINESGSRDFWRLRVGIGRPPEGVEANDYVLEHFSPQEGEILDSIYPQILVTVKDWVLHRSKTEDREQRTDSEGRKRSNSVFCHRSSRSVLSLPFSVFGVLYFTGLLCSTRNIDRKNLSNFLD